MIKKEKGSVTLLVAVTVLFIIVLLSSSLVLVSLKRKSQLQESKDLQEIYGGNNLNEIYQEQLEKKNASSISLTSISNITPDLYGKYVDYGVDLNENGVADDWKIFYQDETDRIFLIAADYVGNTNEIVEACAEKAGMTELDSNYNWETAPEFQGDNEDDIAPIALSNEPNYILTDKYDNSKCVSSLLNKDNWDSLVLSDYADYAIGGPTLEMFISSWNDKGYKTIYSSVTNADSTGYSVGFTENSNTSSIALNTDSSGYDDSLFYPHKNVSENVSGSWLASPSSQDNDSIYFTDYSGTLSGSEDESVENIGLRPVICLKEGIKILWNSEKEVFTLVLDE